MTTFNEIDQRQAKARYILTSKKDAETALRLGLEALELLQHAELSGSRLGQLHHHLSSLFRDLGDLDRCEALGRRALALERADEAEPYALGNYLLFLAKLLNERGNRAEAADLAREGGEAFAHAFKPGDSELALIRSIVTEIIADAKRSTAGEP